MLLRTTHAPHVHRSTTFAAAYADAWAVRDFAGTTDLDLLRTVLVKRGLRAEWVDDAAGWATVSGLWASGVRPGRVSSGALRQTLRSLVGRVSRSAPQELGLVARGQRDVEPPSHHGPALSA